MACLYGLCCFQGDQCRLVLVPKSPLRAAANPQPQPTLQPYGRLTPNSCPLASGPMSRLPHAVATWMGKAWPTAGAWHVLTPYSKCPRFFQGVLWCQRNRSMFFLDSCLGQFYIPPKTGKSLFSLRTPLASKATDSRIGQEESH